MVDEIKAFNMLSEMIIEIREMRNAITRMTQENRDLSIELMNLKEKLNG